MRPLSTQLISFTEFEKDLLNSLVDGNVVGFLLDSKTGDLKKSGLILHPKAVIPLDELLGHSATLFYPDPRRFEGGSYFEAVTDFSRNLGESDHVRYEFTTPALLLMTYREGHFERVTVLSLDTLPMCMWHTEVFSFVKAYMMGVPLNQSQGHWWSSMIKSHAETIGVEAVKACVSVFFNKLSPL